MVEETEELSHRLSELKAAIDGKLYGLRPLSIPEKPILAGHSVSSKVATPSQDTVPTVLLDQTYRSEASKEPQSPTNLKLT